MPNQLLHVRIVSPRQIIFEGEALAVSSKNISGQFDILPFHASFISFIENYPITVILEDKKKLQFKFPFAIISQSSNKVDVYVELQNPLPN